MKKTAFPSTKQQRDCYIMLRTNLVRLETHESSINMSSFIGKVSATPLGNIFKMFCKGVVVTFLIEKVIVTSEIFWAAIAG